MGRMPSHRIGQLVVVGPCPGCYIWTLEYDLDDAPAEGLLWVVEAALEEHLDECPGLQEIVRTML